ncbi:MAG TPA: hypothetical protein PKC39_01625 [Ferruginibacter sp.]|nr:hypothetical protein [Ferruginibacter sp.]HMP19634.1 hypothetical protein [Ferruginibacter sp.]
MGLNLTGSDSERYNLYETIECKEDLEGLFEVLYAFTDANKNKPVVTALSLVANPDFEKIKNNDFTSYYYEPFTETLKSYNRAGVLEMYEEGIKQQLFVPQFHGREHLNVAAWMKALQQGDKATHAAFAEGCWGFINAHPYNIIYQAAFDIFDPGEIEVQKTIIQSGLKLFEDIFRYKASFFVPPNGPFNNSLEQVAAQNGIRYMSSSKIQNEPLGFGKTKMRFHYLGQKNNFDQLYITRNCFFEPSQQGRNWVDTCVNEIDIAFKWKKPAVISSHRVNYIGGLDESNRKKGLDAIKTLLKTIVTKWPEAEFMTSSQLGETIRSGK